MPALSAKFCSLLIIGSVYAAACGSDTTTSDPMERIRTEIIGPMGWDEKVIRLYGMDQPLQPGQTVGPALAVDGSDAQVRTIDKPTWFFWADTSLNPLFAHKTHFITMNEDGSNLEMVDQQWFPVIDGKVFHPDKPLWGPTDPGQVTQAITDELTPYCAISSHCGLLNYALVLQGVNHGWVDKSVDRLVAALKKRDYQEVITFESIASPEARARAFTQKLIDLSKKSKETAIGQLDLFYVGHGTKFNLSGENATRGLWVLGQSELSPVKLKLNDITESLQEIDAQKINIVVESCHSGAFKNGLAQQEAIPIRVISSCQDEQKSTCNTEGCLHLEKLLDQLDKQDDTLAVNLDTAVIAGFDATAADGTTIRQDPTSHLEPPLTPVLYLEDANHDCQVVGTLESKDKYFREVKLRGAGFGSEQGTGKVMLYRWDWAGELVGEFFELFRFPIGDGVELSVTYWADDAIIVEIPMRSLGFPSDPTVIDEILFDGKMWADPLSGYYHMGRYFVQVTTNDGKKTRDFKTLTNGEVLIPGAVQKWFRPQLIHINPCIRSTVWIPDYTNRNEYEWHEIWHPITPASPAVGKPTILMSDLRLIDPGEKKPVFPYLNSDQTFFDEITLRAYDLGDTPHTTGAKALDYGGWSYTMLPGINPAKDTACDPKKDPCTPPDPKFTYWSLRMGFEDGWNGTLHWSSILIYD